MVTELKYAAVQYLILPIPDLQELSISWVLPGEKMEQLKTFAPYLEAPNFGSFLQLDSMISREHHFDCT